ncbi:VOC family protein [Celeribacter sp.]|uniref:VOC family protein n=1 Tax=Celeribacter sp. TaxID=1890673 RepID=UPI003A948533
MHLGCFSVSLSVKDLSKSRAFYEVLGFEIFHDASDHGYCIMRQGDTLIGLYSGMFEGNILTFNPGWTQGAEPYEPFDDVRAVQERLQAAGIALEETADPEGEGVAHITLIDPDGNAILIDQHVPKPKG